MASRKRPCAVNASASVSRSSHRSSSSSATTGSAAAPVSSANGLPRHRVSAAVRCSTAPAGSASAMARRAQRVCSRNRSTSSSPAVIRTRYAPGLPSIRSASSRRDFRICQT